MYNKFIITQEGVLRFGNVYLHRDLLRPDEECTNGGGLWRIDNVRGGIVLYGRSFDFGRPEINRITGVEWQGVGGRPLPLFYQPQWPDEETIIAIVV